MAEPAKTEEVVQEFDLDAFIEALGLGEEIPPVTLSTGKVFTPKKATAAQLFLILDILKSVASHLDMDSFEDLTSAIAKIQRPADFLGMLEASTDKILKLAADLSGISHEGFMTFGLDDIVLVLWVEWTVNEHFFTKQLLPLIQRLSTGQELETLSENSQESAEG